MGVKLKYFLAAVSAGVHTVLAANDDPLLLIHGLGGTADTWGYRDTLEDEGMTTFAVDVGKFTSNWDRACEAYAQMKGTVVDYGVCHSEEFGHLRYGADYTGQGLYPEWSSDNKVHVMGHSMGGPTMRVLEYLLREGSGCAEDTSELFQGGNDWITSVTSISGVLDGTTFIEDLEEAELLDLIEAFIVGLAGLLDNTFLDDLFTIEFAQWGLERGEDESFEDFWARVCDSGLLSPDNKDISTYDLSPTGAREFNAKSTLAYSDTYYFSFATERTNYNIFTGYEQASSYMNLFLQIPANIIGKDDVASKRKNDGLVNWENQLCPTKTDADRDNCVEYDGDDWDIGVWTYMDVNFLDHIQVTLKDDWNDFWFYSTSAKKLYVDHARRLQDL